MVVINGFLSLLHLLKLSVDNIIIKMINILKKCNWNVSNDCEKVFSE